MSTNDAAMVQKSAKFNGDAGMYNAMIMAKEAQWWHAPNKARPVPTSLMLTGSD
jgi:hypothetical protein